MSAHGGTGLLRCWVATVALFAVLFVAGADPAEAARKKHAKPAVDRYASIVIDAATGAVLSSRNPDKRLYPASLTKMVTLYLTFEALQNGRLQKNQRIPVSNKATRQEPSVLGLQPGSSIRVEDAILALVTKSANDVAVVLAEAIGGSESGFARMMNEKAAALGMTSSRFVNASGLHHPSQVSTARDMARLGQALIYDFPAQYRYFSTNSFSYAGVSYNNHNKLMSSYTGMDGIKTGYVYASGFNLVASARRGDTRLIGVVFGGKTAGSRNVTMGQLLDAGFERASDVRVAGLQKKAPARQALAAAKSSSVAHAAPQRKPSAQKPVLASLSPALSLEPLAETEIALDEGDTSDGALPPVTDNHIVAIARPAPPVGGWAVQVGAFSSHDASLEALKNARTQLPGTVLNNTQYMIAPLMTNRGMIYRARLAGLGKEAAAKACRVLKGDCLVLAMQ